MNISELNFDDEVESEGNSMNAEELGKHIAYHFVPKKTEGLIKHEKALIGEKEEPKPRVNVPIVIEIDEDELMGEDERPVVSRASTRRKPQRERGGSNLLRMEEDPNEEVESIQVRREELIESSEESSNYFTRRRRAAVEQKQKKQAEPGNLVIWDEEPDAPSP